MMNYIYNEWVRFLRHRNEIALIMDSYSNFFLISKIVALQGAQGQPGGVGEVGAKGSLGLPGDRGEPGKPGEIGKRVRDLCCP